MTVERGSPSDLAGLLVVNPKDPGNEGTNHDSGAEAHEQPKGGDGAPSEVDWENDEPTDTGDGTPPGDDEPTGDGEAPSDDGEADGEEPGEQPEGDDEPLYDVTIDGKQEKVSLKEALASYSRQADYTRKTEEVARQREALNAELDGVRAHRASYKQVLDALEARLGPANQEPTPEQWEQLKSEDPSRYATEWADYQRRQEQRTQINAERQRVQAEERTEATNALKAYVSGEQAKLIAASPHWKGKDGKIDAEKMKAELTEIREYGLKNGFSEQEINQAYDHRIVLAFRKAAAWDKAEAARTAAKGKIAAAPELPARGSRVKPQTPIEARKKEAQKKFDKSGRVDDAVDLLLS